MVKVTIKATISEKLTSEEYEELLMKLMEFGMENIDIEEE